MLTTLLADRDRYDGGDGKGFFFLLFLALIGTGIFFAVRAIRRRRGGDQDRPSARRLLDERFARGDIDRAEYEHRKAVLDGADVVPPAPAAAPPTMPAPPPVAGAATAVVDAPVADGSIEPDTAGEARPDEPSDTDEEHDGSADR